MGPRRTGVVGVNDLELADFHHQVDARLARVEAEVDGLLSVKKWIMSLVLVFTLQLGGFVYGYGGMSERLDNTVRSVQINTEDRFYRSEAEAMETSIRRELELQTQIVQERYQSTLNRLRALEVEVHGRASE